MKWLLLALALCSFPFAVNSVDEDDWPQFRGKNRDGVAHAIAELKPWPKQGPRLAWRVNIGEGFSGVSVSGDRLFTMFADGKNEFLASFELASGKEAWRVQVDEMLKNRHGNGPRSTPAVDEKNVYGLSSRGHLLAVEKKTGKLQWEAFCKRDFRSEGPGHGFSSSPLVEDNLLLLQTEAGNGKAVVAFDKRSGRVLWNAGYGGDGYCSPTSFVFDGERQFLFVAAEKAIALSAAGKILWEKRAAPGLIAMPLFIAPDKVFVLGSGEATGERKWAQRGFGEGSVILAGGYLIIMGGKGNVALAQATPEKYLEIGSFQALQGKCWTAPAIARNKLLLRNHTEMVCYDLAVRN